MIVVWFRRRPGAVLENVEPDANRVRQVGFLGKRGDAGRAGRAIGCGVQQRESHAQSLVGACRGHPKIEIRDHHLENIGRGTVKDDGVPVVRRFGSQLHKKVGGGRIGHDRRQVRSQVVVQGVVGARNVEVLERRGARGSGASQVDAAKIKISQHSIVGAGGGLIESDSIPISVPAWRDQPHKIASWPAGGDGRAGRRA